MMRGKKYVLMFWFVIDLLFNAHTAFSKNAACDELIGGLVFKDTLYGAATGALLTWLAVTAQDQDSRQGQMIAGGTLAGGAIGAGLGLAEFALRDCGESQVQEAGTVRTDFFTQPEPGLAATFYGLRMTYAL